MFEMRRFVSNLWQKLGNSNFFRHAFILASGSMVAQLIVFAAIPVITRLYGPEALGMLGTFIAIISIIIPVASLCYSHAIVLPKDDESSLGLLRLVIVIAFVVSVITLCVVYLFSSEISLLIGVNESLILAIFTIVFFASVSEGFDFWIIRKKHFSINAKISIYSAVLSNALIISVGLIYANAEALIIATAVGYTLRMLLSVWGSLIGSSWQIVKRVLGKPSVSIANKYKEFAIYRTPQMLLNSFSHSAPVLFLATYFGALEAGYYALCVRALRLPSSVVSQAFGKVFLQKIAEKSHDGIDLRKEVLKSTAVLFVLGFIPFGVVIVWGEELFSFVFGKEWYEAGNYARWISLMLFFMFLNVPAVQALSVLGRQRYLFIWEIFATSGKMLVLIISVLFNYSDNAVVMFLSIFGAFAYALLISGVVRRCPPLGEKFYALNS